MGWSIGYDSSWRRDIGYGVPATCDHPGCGEKIDRGLSYVCSGQPMGGDLGCGLYFCSTHRGHVRTDADGEEMAFVCERSGTDQEPFEATADEPEWMNWKLTDLSWERWRRENPELVKSMRAQLSGAGA